MLQAKPHYRVAEVASFFDVTPQCIYRQIHEGHIKAVRVGAAVRIPRAEVLKLEADVGEAADA